MTLALSLFVLFYILMLAVQQYRPWVALGGAGALMAKSVQTLDVIAWPDLGCEAVRRLTVQEMPLTRDWGKVPVPAQAAAVASGPAHDAKVDAVAGQQRNLFIRLVCIAFLSLLVFRHSVLHRPFPCLYSFSIRCAVLWLPCTRRVSEANLKHECLG